MCKESLVGESLMLGGSDIVYRMNIGGKEVQKDKGL